MASTKVTLRPGEERMVPVFYKPLPKDRSFLFTSNHEAVANAVIDARTPRVALVRNSTPGPMTLQRKHRIGTISECDADGYFSASWVDVCETAIAAQVLNVVEGDPDLSIQDAVEAVTKDYSVPINVELDLAPDTPLAVNTEGGQAKPSETPPQAPEKHSTLGIRMGEKALDIVTEEGVHIFAGSKKVAAALAKLVARFPALWKEGGLVDMPEEDMMRVPLVEGWQNHKVAARMYPVSKKDQAVIDEVFDALHKQGKMDWVKHATPFAHPVFVVWRETRNGPKGRPVIDLRILNSLTIPDNYPLPLQGEIIAFMRGKVIITVIDAVSFFYQFGVWRRHRDRFTLITHRGLEQPTVAQMGFKNTPAYVQRFMDMLLEEHKEYCRVYIDDIVIASNSIDEHLQHLDTIFTLFTTKNIVLSPKKSYLGYPSVELLGFHVDGFGMSTTQERIEAFRNLAFPNNLKALEQYIGSTGFLRHLIAYYAQLVDPLQLRKVSLLATGREQGRVENGKPARRAAYCAKTFFEPTPVELEAFEALQKAICEDPTILCHLNPLWLVFLQIDGSLERGFGGMLFHLKPDYEWIEGSPIPANQVMPIMFLSKVLTKAETRYGPSELEVACLVWAVRKLRTQLHCCEKPVIVLTDHSATRGIIEQTSLRTTSTDRANRRLINASIYLSQYKLKVYHVPGKLNFVPDALSRLKTKEDIPGDVNPDGVPVLDDVWYAFSEAQMDDDLRRGYTKAYTTDKKFSKIVDYLKECEVRNTEDGDIVFFKAGYPFFMRNGLIYNQQADGTKNLCIPHKFVKDVLETAHDDKHHFGRNRMMYDLKGVSFPNKTRLVRQYVEHCPACQLNQTDRNPPIGDYQPIRPEETLPMRIISIDFIVGLPEVSSIDTPWQMSGHSTFDALMPVTDKASKRSVLIPGHTKYTAEEWGIITIRILLLADWGLPIGIISDRDRKFTSAYWQGMWKAMNTKLLMTTAYHPPGNGAAERKNQTVEIAIRFHVFCHELGYNWLLVIPYLQFNLNSAYVESIKASPHEFLLGHKLLGPLDVIANAPPSHSLADNPAVRDHIRQEAQLAMDFAIASAKERYDSSHRQVDFQVGDKVMLKLHQGYHLPGRPSRKTSQQRTGPFKVIQKVGKLAYRLELPPTMKIHPVISVAHLASLPKGDDPFHRTPPAPGPVEDSQSDSDPEAGISTSWIRSSCTNGSMVSSSTMSNGKAMAIKRMTGLTPRD